MKCLVVDDEIHALELIEAYAKKLPFLELVSTCSSSIQAWDILKKQPIDLIFLDIQLPNLNGFELLKTLDPKPFVIIISAFPKYALDGYKWDVIDFLLKPVSLERFIEAASKAHDRIQQKPDLDEDEKEQFFVKGEYKMIRLDVKDILFIESFREYAHVHTVLGKHVVRKSLNSFEQLLSPDKFMRVHRSFIIRLDKIDAIYGNRLEIGDEQIPIGRNYKQSFMDKLNLL